MSHHQNVWLTSVPTGRFSGGVQPQLQSAYQESLTTLSDEPLISKKIRLNRLSP